MPSACRPVEPEYKNLVLNERVEVNNPFISRGVWDACGTPVAPLEGVQVYGGLDLSATMDQRLVRSARMRESGMCIRHSGSPSRA